MPTFGFGFSSSENFDLLLKKPNTIASIVLGSIATTCESARLSCPLIWDQEKDSYYEPTLNNYYNYVASGSQITATNGYKSEPDLTVHSYIKVCNMLENRTINYYITIDPSSFEGNPGIQSDGTGNSTVGKIAGKWERIIADYVEGDSNGTVTIEDTGGYQYAVSSTRNQLLSNGQLLDSSPNYNYEFSSLQKTNHNLITGSKVRCINTGNSILELNKIYYVIRISDTSFRVSSNYQDALNGVSININAGQGIVFSRQSGWILVEEGGVGYGNGGSPIYGGKGNSYIRNPYDKSLKARVSLPSYNSSKSYMTGDRVLGSIVINQVDTVLVWECLDNQDIRNAVSPSLGVVDADLTGVHGDVMLEIPEFYVRKDHFDGVKWTNIKGGDVSKDYTIGVTSGAVLGTVVSAFTTGENVDFHCTWLLHKKQYEGLSENEKAKYLLHPAFMKESDSLAVRTYRLTAKEAGLEMPTGNTLANGQEAIVSRHPHYLVVGKAVRYYDPIDKSIPRSIINSVNLQLGTYYVSSIINSTTYNISNSKGGSSLTGYHATTNVYGYGLKGYWFPVVTTVAQNIVQVVAGVGGGATFTTVEDHQFLIGQKVQISYAGTLENFSRDSIYYVTNPDYSNFSFQLCTSLSNAVAANPIVVQFSNANNLSNVVAIPEVIPNTSNPELIVNSITGNDSLNLDWLPGHTTHFLATGHAVVYKGSINGLTTNNIYYVIVVTDSFTVKLANSYENAMLGVSITNLSGEVKGSSLKRADYLDVQIEGTTRDILIVNNNNSNSYRVVYKGLFAGTADVVDITVTGISNTNNAPMTFTSNAHGLNNNNTVYLSYSERCNLGYFGRYHHQNNYYWVIKVNDNEFQLATQKGGIPINYISSGTSSWAEFVSSGGIKVSVYKANSVKIKGANDSFSLGILGVGNNNNIQLCTTADDLNWAKSFVTRFRTGQQVTYGLIRTIQNARNFSSKVGSSGNILIKNGLKFRFRIIGNLSNVNTESVYEVRNKNDSTGEFDIVLEGTSTVINIQPAGGLIYNGLAVIKPVIFDDIAAGNYFINRAEDNTITLHKTYNESLTKTNPINIRSQPNYRNSASNYDNTNTANAYDYDFYGQLHRADDCLCLDGSESTKNNERSVTESTNKNLNYYKGSGLIVNALQLLAVQEFRKMDLIVTNINPFINSNRVSLFYYFNATEAYTTVEENAIVLNNYAVPINNIDIIKPVFLKGRRYNSLVGCITTKNLNMLVRKTNNLTTKSSMWYVLGFPSRETLGLGINNVYDVGVHSDVYRIFNNDNTVYNTRAASFSEGSPIYKGWQYFLTT